MIVKVKNNQEDCWNYFEGDRVIQHVYSEDKVSEHNEETLYLYDTESQKSKRIQLHIHKDKKVVHRILTNQPTYLMNNDGKTVDKLM